MSGEAASGGCFLCAKAQEGRDDANFILHRGEHGYILLNLYPYNSGHLMVAPYGHVGDLASLDSTRGCALWLLTQRAVEALQAEYHPDGFNIGMNVGRAAGAGLPDHVHVHVVPRWLGDTNYMTAMADTKVMPETLAQTYRRLKQHFPA